MAQWIKFGIWCVAVAVMTPPALAAVVIDAVTGCDVIQSMKDAGRKEEGR